MRYFDHYLNVQDRISTATAALASGVVGFGLTGGWDKALLAAAIGAFFTAVPKIITSFSEARKAYSGILQGELSTILATNAAQIQYLQEQLENERNANRLLKISKHAILNAYQNAAGHLIENELLAKQHGLELPKAPRPPLHELTREEDEGMAKMVRTNLLREEVAVAREKKANGFH